jgi:hypothetical protein
MMSILYFILESVGSASLVAALLWLLRHLIQERLSAAVKGEFDAKLATLNSQLRASEERIKADLKDKQDEIAALRTSPLSAMLQRQVEIDKRHIKAIEQLWDSVISLKQARSISQTVGMLKMEEVSKRLSTGDKRIEAFLDTVIGNFDMKSIDLQSAEKARPFISQYVWSIYSAYNLVCTLGPSQILTVKAGIGSEVFDHNSIKSVLLAALPHRAEFIEKNGINASYLLIDEIEQQLLTAIRVAMEGSLDDKNRVKQAADIAEAVNATYEKRIVREGQTAGVIA